MVPPKCFWIWLFVETFYFLQQISSIVGLTVCYSSLSDFFCAVIIVCSFWVLVLMVLLPKITIWARVNNLDHFECFPKFCFLVSSQLDPDGVVAHLHFFVNVFIVGVYLCELYVETNYLWLKLIKVVLTRCCAGLKSINIAGFINVMIS